jgi:hypothetical protein
LIETTIPPSALEQEDFFFWTARLWNDPEWRREVAKNWSATRDVP